jgi:DNA-binding NtrC family response regulator
MLAQFPAVIPFSPAPFAPRRAGDFPQLREKSASRVLIVDDEALFRWSIAETLRAHGRDIVEAPDASAAIAVLADPAARPDAVLLDLKLPDSDDLSLLASVRRLAPGRPVILVTAFGTPEVMDEAIRLGAFTVLDKPFDLDAIDDVIERALNAAVPG